MIFLDTVIIWVGNMAISLLAFEDMSENLMGKVPHSAPLRDFPKVRVPYFNT